MVKVTISVIRDVTITERAQIVLDHAAKKSYSTTIKKYVRDKHPKEYIQIFYQYLEILNIILIIST